MHVMRCSGKIHHAQTSGVIGVMRESLNMMIYV